MESKARSTHHIKVSVGEGGGSVVHEQLDDHQMYKVDAVGQSAKGDQC